MIYPSLEEVKSLIKDNEYGVVPICMELYSDQIRMQKIVTEASTVFYLIPLPVAVFILASVEAGTDARQQLNDLLDGKTVPFSASVGREIDTYPDYLALLLLTLDEEVKLARLMDVIQLDLTYCAGSSFRFIDYCYGFDVKIDYVKHSYFFGLTGIGDRHKEVFETFTYR